MALSKVFQKYLSNIFVSIVKDNNEWNIYSKVIKNGTIKDKSSQTFEISNNDELPVKMKAYLEKIQMDYNFAYISLFLDSMGQGAINGTTAIDFEKNSIDMKSVSHFDIDNKWSVYASYIDINSAKKLFNKVGLDFIYSPFMVQNQLIKSQKLKEKPTLYILNHQDSVTISVFENGNLLFGAYFQTTTDIGISGVDEDWEHEAEEEGLDDLVELDPIENDTTELSDLDDLDDLDEDESSEDFEELKSDDKNSDIDNADSSLELYGKDTLIYKYLISSINEFYRNSLYKSNFIQTIVIDDGYEVSSDLIDMIENDLLMEIEMNKININEIVCDMSKMEVF